MLGAGSEYSKQRENRSSLCAGFASACLLALALAGCGDDPVKPKPPGDAGLPHYFPPTSPQNVLQNLVIAYEARDSVGTAAVYDSAYVGSTVDPSAPTPYPDRSRQDEVRHVGRLRLDPNLVSVFVDLGLPSSWQRLPGSAGDPAGWAVIQISNNTVRIEDIGRATTWNAMNNFMEYAFKPTIIGPDTTWTVVRWTEIAN